MRKQRNASSIWKLIIAILTCEAIGFTSGLIGSAAMNSWFDNLQKPSWNPPAYLFAPVWTLLYALMGIAFWLIWKNETAEANKRSAYVAFALQLFLNFWWSIIFFQITVTIFCLDRDSPDVVGDPFDDLPLLENLKNSRMAACSICFMGVLCQFFELYPLESKLLNNGEQICTTLSKISPPFRRRGSRDSRKYACGNLQKRHHALTGRTDSS
nr:TspO/MBR family protein [Haliscomenobacter sp.]